MRGGGVPVAVDGVHTEVWTERAGEEGRERFC